MSRSCDTFAFAHDIFRLIMNINAEVGITLRLRVTIVVGPTRVQVRVFRIGRGLELSCQGTYIVI